MNDLRDRLNQIETTVAHKSSEKSSDIYLTDEEDLSKETAWVIQRRKRQKRKASTTPENRLQQSMVSEIKSKNVSTRKQNTFVRKENTIKKPPPINVTNVSNYKLLYDLVYNPKHHMTEEMATMNVMNNNIVKIDALDE